jgi:hypothetical protein
MLRVLDTSVDTSGRRPWFPAMMGRRAIETTPEDARP